VRQARRVAIVGVVGLPAQYGGFETLAHFLVKDLGDKMDLTVYCSGPEYKVRRDTYASARLKYLPFRANGAQSVIFDAFALASACLYADVVLVLGVSGGLFFTLARLAGKRMVLNIGGLEWQRSKWSKFASRFLKLSEAVAVKSVDVLVADNVEIGAYLSREYAQPSTLIEYGGDQVSLPEVTEDRRCRYPFLQAPYAFSVARIQSDNNIEMILEAFAGMPGHPLVFVGNWEKSAFGREVKTRFANRPNLHLLEAIYDPEELNTLRGHCSLYIHGHSAGGTNPALVEAMHLGLPIAAFDVSYNRATTEEAGRYFSSAAELAALLERVPPEEWESQREKMKEIAIRRYRWSVIAQKYAEVLNA
jgi:glycosyltransferase involved in cell wall biosynthesis